MSSTISPLRIAARVAPFLLLAACGDGPGDPALPAPARIAYVSGAAAGDVEVGTSAGAPVFLVTDSAGRPRAGVVVTFSARGEGAAVVQATDTTDLQGRASPGTWTAGRRTGRDSLVATVASGLETGIGVALRPGPLAELVPSTAQYQPTRVHIPIADPVSFTARDRFGNAVPGVTVRFTTSAPPQSASGTVVTPASTVTDAQGVARVASWMFLLGGVNVLTASNEAGTVTGTVTSGSGAIGGCMERRVLAVPFVGNDSYSAADCPVLGRTGQYMVHVEQPSFVRYTVDAPGSARESLILFDYAERSRRMGHVAPSVRALLLPGIYRVRAGDYERETSVPLAVTLRGESVPESVTGCEPLWLPFTDVVTDQSWSSTDCNGPVPGLDATARVFDVVRFDVGMLDTIPPIQIELETSVPGDVQLVLSGDEWAYEADGSPRLAESHITSVAASEGRAVLARQFNYRYERHTLRIVAPAGSTGSYRLRIRRMPGTGVVGR